jgi:hypothetical protein
MRGAALAVLAALALAGCASTGTPAEQRPEDGLARVVTDARDAPGSLAPVAGATTRAPAIPVVNTGPTRAEWRRAADPICRSLARARRARDTPRYAGIYGRLARVRVPAGDLRRWIAFITAESQRLPVPKGLPKGTRRFYAKRNAAARTRSRAALRGLGFRVCGRV